MKKIPILIVSGYLGSGKTTFINNLLSEPSGLKIGVIVNDFGAINIDSMLVEQVADEIVSLSNGCLCCTLSNELDDSINKLAYQGSNLDLIIIEASGIADPSQMIQLVLKSQNQYSYLMDSIYIIDGANFIDFMHENHFIAELGIMTSKLILLNKIDLVSPTDLAEIETIINEINKDALLIKTKDAKINLELLLDHKHNEYVQTKLGQNHESVCKHCGHNHEHNEECEHHHDHEHEHKHENIHGLTSHSFESNEIFDPLLITDFLNHLPKEIYRLKGFINFGKKAKNKKVLIQIVGRHHSLSGENWNGNKKTQLVTIGTDFDTAKFDQDLLNCIDQNPDNVRPENTIADSILK